MRNLGLTMSCRRSWFAFFLFWRGKYSQCNILTWHAWGGIHILQFGVHAMGLCVVGFHAFAYGCKLKAEMQCLPARMVIDHTKHSINTLPVFGDWSYCHWLTSLSRAVKESSVIRDGACSMQIYHRHVWEKKSMYPKLTARKFRRLIIAAIQETRNASEFSQVVKGKTINSCFLLFCYTRQAEETIYIWADGAERKGECSRVMTTKRLSMDVLYFHFWYLTKLSRDAQAVMRRWRWGSGVWSKGCEHLTQS